jgi:hypothetical protein
MKNAEIKFAVLVGMVAVLATTAEAQPATENVEVDPITCWWRTTTSAVRTGEPFGLTLTCAVVDTEASHVVPDQSRLDAAVVQLPPFEVLGGSHPGDLRTPGKRFFQYEYRLRVIAEDTFGNDVMIPALEISYRIESRVSSGDSVQGRDLTYSLPRAAIRVISLVPDDTTDIREAPASMFTEIESRVSRANLFQTLAGVLYTLAGLVLVIMLVGLVRTRSAKTTLARTLLSDRAILRAVSKELAAVQRESRGGWTTELAGRALAASRVAGSYALGRKLGQHPIDRGAAVSDGQVLVAGRLGGAAGLVSASVTAESIPSSNAFVGRPFRGAGTARADVQELANGLRALTAARYGRIEAVDAGADEALEAAMRIARQQSSAHSLIAEWTSAFVQSAQDLRKRVWA